MRRKNKFIFRLDDVSRSLVFSGIAQLASDKALNIRAARHVYPTRFSFHTQCMHCDRIRDWAGHNLYRESSLPAISQSSTLIKKEII